MNKDYHETRIPYDDKRSVLWQTLADFYFKNYIKPEDTVLEIGAGYCDFINNVEAAKKIAVDLWDQLPEYANKDVECIVGDIEQIESIDDESIDYAFASNIFEHITADKLAIVLEILKRKLKKDGSLCILQPNYKLAYKEYFDDYTHVSIWSDQSLSDFLMANGLKVKYVKAGFLPLSIKSRFPVHPLLIRLYLKLPFKVFAKQMLVVASR
jgi:ubiquinone/menaquinone biosynthesis C-methylase UbiE